MSKADIAREERSCKCGLSYVIRSPNIKRVACPDSKKSNIHTVDPDGVEERKKKRVYRNPFSNFVWHIDGNHKLVRWRLVIHHTILWLQSYGSFCKMLN